MTSLTPSSPDNPELFPIYFLYETQPDELVSTSTCPSVLSFSSTAHGCLQFFQRQSKRQPVFSLYYPGVLNRSPSQRLISLFDYCVEMRKLLFFLAFIHLTFCLFCTNLIRKMLHQKFDMFYNESMLYRSVKPTFRGNFVFKLKTINIKNRGY